MLIALSRFTIANDKLEEVRSAFLKRPHLVESAPGFLGMEVMSPTDTPAEVWLVTRWLDEQSFRSWDRSQEDHKSHDGIHKGVKLVPRTASLRLFEVFAD